MSNCLMIWFNDDRYHCDHYVIKILTIVIKNYFISCDNKEYYKKSKYNFFS